MTYINIEKLIHTCWIQMWSQLPIQVSRKDHFTYLMSSYSHPLLNRVVQMNDQSIDSQHLISIHQFCESQQIKHYSLILPMHVNLPSHISQFYGIYDTYHAMILQK